MKRIVVVILATITMACGEEMKHNITRYIMANVSQFGNKLEEANKWYSQITPDEHAIYVYHGYIDFLYSAKQYRTIVNLIPQIDAAYKKNMAVQMIFADSFLQIGNKEEAHKRLIGLNEQYKTNLELAFKVTQIYIERRELENALLVIDSLLNKSPRRPNNYLFLFLKSQIYLQLNNKQEALKAILACIDVYPKYDKSWLIYAVLQEQEGKIQEAIKGFTHFLEVTTEPHAEIEQHLLQLALQQKLASQRIITQDNGQCITTALQLLEQKQYKRALVFIDQCLAQAPQDIPARILKIQALALDGHSDAALQHLKQWIVATSADAPLWLRMLHLLCTTGLPVKQALELVRAVENQLKNNELVSLYHADFALRVGNTQEALSALSKAYALTKDVHTQEKILFQQARLYYDKQDWKSLSAVAEKAFALETHFAPLLNMIAYHDATKGNNLVRAQKSIDAALKIEPTNVAFADTQAVIWYKQEQFDKAIMLLENNVKGCTGDCILLRRLGKLHWKNGNPQKAQEYLKLAHTAATSPAEKAKVSKLLREIR